MSLTRAEVMKIARLSRLYLTEEELDHYSEQLSAILDYAAMLNELDLSHIDLQAQTDDRPNVTRDDFVQPSLSPEDALFGAAETLDGQFYIQSILDD